MKFTFFILVAVSALFTGCSEDSPVVSLNPYERGIAAAAEGDFDRAVTALKSALEDEAVQGPAQGSLAIAEKVLSGSLDRQAAIHFFQGITFANEGQMELAYAYFTKAIEAAPEFAESYYERGSVNGRLKLFDKAIADFTRAVELNPGDAPAYNNRGLAYAKGLKEYKKAIADFNRAVELDPYFAEAYDNRGIAYSTGFDDKEKACAEWNKACQLNRCRSYEIAKQNGYCT